MFSRRFPASLEGVILGAIDEVLDDHRQGFIPEWGYSKAEGEMEVNVIAVDQVRVNVDTLRLVTSEVADDDAA